MLYIKEHGWIAAIKNETSVLYLILAYPLSFIFQDFIALRIVNFGLILFFLFYLWGHDKRKNILLYSFLLFYINAAGFFYSGSNDTLFIFSLVLFLNEVYKASRKRDYRIDIALSGLILAIFTRELFLLFLPVIFLGFYILIKSKNISKKEFVIPSLLLFFVVLVNLPSIISNHKFSYEQKKPPESMNVTWSQRQYLAQLKVNDGTLNFHEHPSWKETQEYLKIHGINSLPKTWIEGLFHDISLTIKEFFKDLIYILIFHTRTLGLILLSILFYSFRNLIKKRHFDEADFVPFSALTMILIFSIIIISYVELRWLAPVFILAIIYYNDLIEKKRISTKIIIPNLLFISFLI